MINVEDFKKEYNELLSQLSDPELISDWEKFEKLNKRKGILEKIMEKNTEIEEIKKKIEANKQILKSPDDLELISLAETEIAQLNEKLKILEKQLQDLISEKNKKTDQEAPIKAVIVEIRPGAGGEEAALFASDLFRAYSKYAQKKGWQQKILNFQPTDLGGIKEISFELKNSDVWPYFKYEAGVHRVQRIPKTEKAGRIHTSTVSVVVLPKPQKGKIVINQNDLKIDTYKSSGPGGQYVNKRMSAVRITHLPTGLVVTSQTERNLQQNKENALSILEAKLLEKQKLEESAKISATKRSQIGRGQRAEKIRTYNFPQNRITDHRIKKTFHNIEEIMEGNLDSLITQLQKSLV
ncbi:MAG: peptide chain release factor 1 [Minisyncoccales bacterium]